MNIIKLFVASYLILSTFIEWNTIHCMEEKEDSYDMGTRYYEGIGVENDKVEAAKWFQKAAKDGHVTAQFRLAICYEIGEGVSQNKEEAMKWFQKAAEQGHIIAQFNVGVCYEIGKGISQNKEEAIKWFQKAAEQGNVSAQKRIIKLNSELSEHSSTANQLISSNKIYSNPNTNQGHSISNSAKTITSQDQMKHPPKKIQKQNAQKILTSEEFQRYEETAQKAIEELLAEEESALRKRKQPTRANSTKVKGKERKKKAKKAGEPVQTAQITGLKKTEKLSCDKLGKISPPKISAVNKLSTIIHSPQTQKQDNTSKHKQKSYILAPLENKKEATNSIRKIKEKKKRNQKDCMPIQEVKEQEKKVESKEEENSSSEMLEQTEPKTISVNSNVGTNDGEEKAVADANQLLQVYNQSQSISDSHPKSHKQKSPKTLWDDLKEMLRKKKPENPSEIEKEVRAEDNITTMSSPVLYPNIANPTAYMGGESREKPYFSGQIRYIQVAVPFPVKIPVYIPIPTTYLRASRNTSKPWVPYTQIKYEDDKKIVTQWNDEGRGSIHIIHPDSDAIELEYSYLDKRLRHLKNILKMHGSQIEDEDQFDKRDRNPFHIIHHGGESAKQKNDELKKTIFYLEKLIEEMNLEIHQ